MIYQKLSQSVETIGLQVRGNFHNNNETGYLIGHGGSSFWPFFQEYLAKTEKKSDHPLDDWSKKHINEIACQFKGRAVYPSDGPPYAPFQQWIKEAENLKQSPIGMMIHPQYGLWHAYRAVIFIDGHQELQIINSPDTFVDICKSCETKVCLSSCPAQAYQQSTNQDITYDVPTCVAALKTNDGKHCKTQGCYARRQCPIGQQYIYNPEQAAFHMTAFLKDK